MGLAVLLLILMIILAIAVVLVWGAFILLVRLARLIRHTLVRPHPA